MSPNKLQQEAIEYLDGPLLVLAGPGTGKTELLSRKVLHILENTDASPDNILCITFTDSAANNMRDRLAAKIGPAAEKVNIYTYHSFGVSILNAYKNYAPSSKKLDDAISDVKQYRIISEIQQNLPVNDILRGDKITDILATIGSAKSARLTPEDLAIIAEDNIEADEKLNQAVQKSINNWRARMPLEEGLEKVYYPLLETILEFTNEKPIVKNIEKKANVLARELKNTIDEVLSMEKPKISPLTDWLRDRFVVDENGEHVLSDRVANLKLKSLSNVMRTYQNYLSENGLYDFSDMIEEAITALKTDEGFRLTMSERFLYIMLDEFQDTNDAQAELIRAITDYEKPCVMAVGDDDQAIFAFQGANSSNLIDFENHYHAKVIVLTENYRSTKEILGLSRKVADQLIESFAKKHSIEKTLNPNSSYETCHISRHEFMEASAENYWVASRISELISSGVKQSEIAIIAPKHKYILPLLPYLKSHDNISISYEKRDNLLENQYIYELITMAKFVYDIASGENPSHRLLEILSFDFWEIDKLSVITSVERVYGVKKSAIEYLTSSEDEKIKATAEFFAELVAIANHAPLELFIDYLIGTVEVNSKKSPFLTFYSQQNESIKFELYESLTVLREAIKEYTKNGSPKLADLITMINDYESASKALLNTSPYQESADSVQVLTAHKSKGLEFSYVFLIATDDHNWGKGGGNNNWLVLPKNLIQIRHTGTTDDELIRLFFVAITRAKHHLYITNSIKDFSGKTVKRLAYLSEYIQKNEAGEEFISSPLIPAESVEKHYQDLPEDKQLSHLDTHWLSKYQHFSQDIKETLQNRLKSYHVSATDLTTFVNIAYAGPAAFYERKILRAPNESYSAGLSIGTIVHSVFEKVSTENISDEEAINFAKSEIEKADLPEADLELVTDRVISSVRASLASFSEILRYKNSKAELNFYNEHPVLNGIPLIGVIDHINIDEENKTIEVYDFKTSKYRDGKWDSHPSLIDYKIQLGFYKLLLNLSPTYSKYTVTRGHILHVTPDALTSNVYDKVYEFNKNDEETLIALIETVYKHIKTLDFVDDPELFIQPDHERSAKQIKNFIELLLDTNH